MKHSQVSEFVDVPSVCNVQTKSSPVDSCQIKDEIMITGTTELNNMLPVSLSSRNYHPCHNKRRMVELKEGYLWHRFHWPGENNSRHLGNHQLQITTENKVSTNEIKT